ncbi:MAG: aryl-sulfate sulfotransferase, partial [Ignavibacteriae bacterium]|nr:aryl-sulfate sulfotransferase [Ignavibacteriota bacterium]
HGNSIAVDTDNNIIISSRHMDEITKINTSTGNIIWRLGGKNNQFTFINDTIGFSHQHDARRINNGHLTLYDNGNFHTPPRSRAIEYVLNETSNPKTATLVWQYRRTPSIYASATGNVQRLPNGNTLIGWGMSNVTLTEVTPAGSIMYELYLPVTMSSYRSFRYEWSPLVGVEPVKNIAPKEFKLYQNYPNPFNPSTNIKYQISNSHFVILKVYNMLGKEVATLVNEFQQAGTYEVIFSGEQLPSGIYFNKLASGDFTDVKKMVLVK